MKTEDSFRQLRLCQCNKSTLGRASQIAIFGRDRRSFDKQSVSSRSVRGEINRLLGSVNIRLV